MKNLLGAQKRDQLCFVYCGREKKEYIYIASHEDCITLRCHVSRLVTLVGNTRMPFAGT